MKDTVTPAELAALTTTAGGKYHSRKTWVEELGRRFDSQHEAECAVGLLRRQQAGEISELRFQEKIRIDVNGVHVCDYVADFRWRERIPGGWWKTVTADAKGFPTSVYRLKKRLMLAVHSVEIQEL